MRMLKPTLLAAGIGMAAFLAIGSWGSLKSVIGEKYRDRIGNLGAEKCLTGVAGYTAIRSCLDGLGEQYEIMGDTIDGNFRILYTRPFSEAHIDVDKWQLSGSGASILETYSRVTCFLHQETEVPNLSEKEKELATKYFQEWVSKNPDAFGRFITKVEETNFEVVIYSAPYEAFKNYTEYCPDWISMKYLDDYKGQEFDRIAIRK